jgi:hypothetical protein
MATKNGETTYFFPFFVVGYGIQDPGSGMEKNPGPQFGFK